MCRSHKKAVQGVVTLAHKNHAARSSDSEVDRVSSTSMRGRRPAPGRQNRNYQQSRHQPQQRLPQQRQAPPSQRSDNSGSSLINCTFCARSHPQGRNNCPAFGKRCNSCHGSNHFAEACNSRTTNVNEVDDEEEDLNMSALYRCSGSIAR